MMTVYIIVVVVAAVVALVPALAQAKALRGLLPGAVGGLLGLGAVQLTAIWGPVMLAANPFTVGIAVLLGLPGVVGMLLLRLVTMI